MEFCGKCGASMQGRGNFCPSCGQSGGVSPRQDAEIHKIWAVMAYLNFLWLIPLFFGMHKKSPFVKHHMNQAVIMMIVSFVIIVAIFLMHVPMLSLITIAFYPFGIISAATGKDKPFPLTRGLKIFK